MFDTEENKDFLGNFRTDENGTRKSVLGKELLSNIKIVIVVYTLTSNQQISELFISFGTYEYVWDYHTSHEPDRVVPESFASGMQ